MSIHMIAGSDGLKLAVHEYGKPDGKPILFIHGFCQCYLVWNKQYESPLAQEFRLLCMDIRGHGMSDKPAAPEHYSEAGRWAEDVRAVITGLGPRRPILVGWSYGGFIINDYVAQYGQDAIGGINYVGAGVLLGVPKAADTFGEAFTGAVPGLCSNDLEDNLRALKPFLRALFARQPSQDEFEAMTAVSMLVPPAVRLGMVSRVIDRDSVLRGLSVPVLVTSGEEDAIVLAAHTRHLLSCVPHARSSVYAGVGHAAPIEDPERFNRELAMLARQHAG